MSNDLEQEKEKIKIGHLEVTGLSSLVTSLSDEKESSTLLDTNAEVVIGVSLSRPVLQDLEREGYSVIADIGPPRQIEISEMTGLAEDVAIIIDKLRRMVKCKSITLVLSCPTAVAFMIGSLLGHQFTYRLLHWDNGYVRVPDYGIKRYRKEIKG